MGKEKDVVCGKSGGKALPLKHEIPDDGNVEDSPDENSVVEDSSGESTNETQERVIPPSMRIRPINLTPINVDRNLVINDDDDDDDDDDQPRNNPGRFPGVFYVPGPTGRSYVDDDELIFPVPRRPSALERNLPDIEQLPQAYLVTHFRPPIQDTPSTPSSTTTQSINNNNHDGNETKPKSKKILMMSILGLVSIVAAVTVAMFVTRNSDDTASPSVVETNNDDSINETTKLDIINLNTNTTNNEASRTNETNQETSNMTNIITTTSSSSDNNDQHSNHSQTTIPCLTNPFIIHVIESDAYKNGDDPSIPRTYHFCPNSVMNMYAFDPIFNTFDQSDGGVFPIVVHRPNVNILCGFDGDYSNNCTFKGGFTQFVFNRRPRHLHYDVNTTAENTTISGFRFTGATQGCTICNRNQIASLTIKNCRFDNNIGMFSSVYMAIPTAVSSILHVHNTTFENNSYTPNPNLYSDNIAHGGSRVLNLNVGAITAFPNPTSKAVVRVNVSDCVFQNNTFLIDSTRSGETGAVINLLPPVSAVQITNSCFSGNMGYSSSLILLGRGREMISEDYNGNHFSSNEQDGIYEQSCILNYQMLSLDAGRIAGVIPQMGCGDYIDLFYNESESSGVCSI